MASKIAFVSCAYAKHRKKDQPAWQQLLDRVTVAKPAKPKDPALDLDLLLLLGDTAYMGWEGDSADDWDHATLEACYQAQFTKFPAFKKLISSVPVLAIWDDHDCGINGVLGAQWPDHVRKSREMFDRWMGFAVNVRKGDEMYCAYDKLPGIRIIMLDGRTYRTHPQASGATLLGSTQEQFLFDQLAEPIPGNQPITIVANGTGLTEGAPTEVVTAYEDFSKTLHDAMAFRAGDPGRRSLFLAGDIHRNFFKTHKQTRIHEVISSGVACFAPGAQYESDLETARHADNWGLMTVDDTHVTIEFHAVNSKSNNFTKVIRRSDWMVEGG